MARQSLRWNTGSAVARVPPATDWPGPNNTGVPAGTSLTPHSGNFTTTSNNEVVDALDITNGALIPAHANVILRRCRISSTDIAAVFISQSASGTLLIEDCELNCNNVAGTTGLFWEAAGPAVTARRLNIHSAENGIGCLSNFDLRDSYIHDLVPGGGAAHIDGLQTSPNVSNVNVIHNNFDMRDNGPANSALQFDVNAATNANWVVENNKFLASSVDGGYTLRLPNVDASAIGIYIRNNRLLSGNFDYVTPIPVTVTEWSNNVDDITGLPVP